MKKRLSPFWRDWLERVLWTLAQAVVGILIVEVGELGYAWAPVIVAGLSALKGFIAGKVGDRRTAALGGPSPDELALDRPAHRLPQDGAGELKTVALVACGVLVALVAIWLVKLAATQV